MNVSARWISSEHAAKVVAGAVGLSIGILTYATWVTYEGREKGISPKISLNEAAAPQPLSTHDDYRNLVHAYLLKVPRGVADRLVFLKTLDLWFSKNTIDCVNGLNAIGAMGVVDQSVLLDSLANRVTDQAVLPSQVSEIRDIDLRDQVVRALFTSMVESTPADAAELLAIVPPKLRRELEATLGKAVGAKGDAKLFSALIKSPHVGRDFVITGLQTWLTQDTPSALSFFDSVDELDVWRFGTSKTRLLGRITPKADPEALIDYLKTKSPSAPITRALSDAIGTLIAKQPDQWDRLAISQNSDVLAASIAANAAEKIVTTAPSAATEFLQRINGLDARIQATRKVARRYYFDPGSSVQKVLSWATSANDPVLEDAIISELRFQHAKLPVEIENQ